MPKLLRMKDLSDDFYISKEKDNMDGVSHRILITGKSGTGKTSLISSLYCLPENYGNIFNDGNSIFLISPMKNDFKMEKFVKFKQIPAENIFNEIDDEIINTIYDIVVDQFEADIRDGKRPKNSLLIIDDCSFSGGLKKGRYNAVNRVMMNGRKHQFSICLSSQKQSQISTEQRSQASSIFFYNASMKEKELFEQDANFLGSRKAFFKMLSDVLKGKRDFIYCNFTSENVKDMYMDKDFNIIDIEKYKLK